MPTGDDEFAEFETDEATFDAMFTRAEPVEIVPGPVRRTVVVEQDGTTFIVTMPGVASLSLGMSASGSDPAPATQAPLSVDRPRYPLPEVLAS